MKHAFRHPLFWFLLPWLLILLVPHLRLMARVQAVGSEYGSNDVLTPLTLWIHPLQPTADKLAHNFAAGQAPPEIFLKAPEERGDGAIGEPTARRLLDATLQKPDAPLWMLAARLRLTVGNLASQRMFPSEPRFDWGNFSGVDIGNQIAIAGHEEWSYDDEDLVSAGSSMVAPPTMGDSEPPAHKQLDLTETKFAVPLKWARRGVAAEPSNAFWRLYIAYVLTLAEHDDEATRELLAAAHCTGYDSHRRDEIRAALAVANLHRPLLWSEKMAVAERQNNENIYPKFEQALLWLSERAENKGDLTVIGALARIAGLMQRDAVTDHDRRRGLLLQSAAWGGATRPAQTTYRGVAIPLWPQHLTAFDHEFGGNNLTPLRFAQNFAAFARQHGQRALARETLSLGREATNRAARLGSPYENLRFDIRPTVLLPAAICDLNAQMALLQVQITGAAWLLLSLMLWRRMAWAGLLLRRGWQLLSLLWRARDRSVSDESPVAMAHTPRDLRLAVWFCGGLILCGTAGMTWWSDTLVHWYQVFSDIQLGDDYDRQLLAYFGFVAGPLGGGLLWCGTAALWRYRKLPPTQPKIEAAHVPSSVIPFVVAFMVWSITAIPLICWLLWAMTSLFGPAALSISLPQQWAWLLQRPANIDLSIREIGIPIVLSFMALGFWVLKWIGQLQPHRRLAALNFGVRWLHATLGVWLILGSWLYFGFLLVALPYHRTADEAIERQFPTYQLLPHENARQ